MGSSGSSIRSRTPGKDSSPERVPTDSRKSEGSDRRRDGKTKRSHKSPEREKRKKETEEPKKGKGKRGSEVLQKPIQEMFLNLKPSSREENGTGSDKKHKAEGE